MLLCTGKSRNEKKGLGTRHISMSETMCFYAAKVLFHGQMLIYRSLGQHTFIFEEGKGATNFIK